MGTVVMIAQLILALAILVVLHEFGHFVAARIFGIRVEKFYMFFRAKFSLLTFKKGEGFRFFRVHSADEDKLEMEQHEKEGGKFHTTFGIGWIPLGGYVKIAGMIDESMDKEAMKKPPQPWEFRSKPAWQRLIVMLGGVIMNLILGIIVLSFVLLQYNKEYLPKDEVNKDGIYAYQTGRDIGFKTGDKIIEIDGKEFERFDDVISFKVLFGTDITVDRNGEKVTISVPDTLYKSYKSNPNPFIAAHNYNFKIDSVIKDFTADSIGIKAGDRFISINGNKINTIGQAKELLFQFKGQKSELVIDNGRNLDTILVKLDTTGYLGFFHSQPDYQYKKYNLSTAFKYGTTDAIRLLIANVKGFGKIFTGEEKASESVAGPIRIAEMFGSIWIWERFWRLVGLLSLVLAFMNILPIPALDGGHVILLLYEWISGRQISDKLMERIQMVGMVIIFALMIFIFGNDIFRLFK